MDEQYDYAGHRDNFEGFPAQLDDQNEWAVAQYQNDQGYSVEMRDYQANFTPSTTPNMELPPVEAKPFAKAPPFLQLAHDHINFFLFAMSVVMFLFVVPIVLASPPDVAHWYSGGDLVRAIDPSVTGTLYVLVALGAPANLRTVLPFCLALIVYVQGNVTHGIAAATKHGIEPFISQCSAVEAAYQHALWFEHTLGHYWYAVGAILVSWAHILGHWDDRHPRLHSFPARIVFTLGAVVNGLIIAAVAVQYPRGIIVVFVYLCIFPALLAFCLHRTGDLFTDGVRRVPQWYLLSWVIAFVIVIIYAGVKHFTSREDHNPGVF
eukprot:TRINITY_DN3144_c0_g2_i1.p1 TRINITY_DN3144_c0_g2~~TRINITY_DN3144_c0_g2_i1.p1  ORF type:complete len:321 (-),score=30.93 TRINITY_DN3144_c0_g2_i1:3-965(-)